jgi:hypothetical protein
MRRTVQVRVIERQCRRPHAFTVPAEGINGKYGRQRAG